MSLGQHAGLADARRAQFPGAAMQPGSGHGGVERVKSLGQQRGDHPGQHVAGARRWPAPGSPSG